MTDCFYSLKDHLQNVEGLQGFRPRTVPQWLRERMDRAMQHRWDGVMCDDCLIDHLIATFGGGDWLDECGLALIDDEECFVMTTVRLDEAVSFGLCYDCDVALLDDADCELPAFVHAICLMPNRRIRVYDCEFYASVGAS